MPAVPDPDLGIRGRPGHPSQGGAGETVSQKGFFALWPQFVKHNMLIHPTSKMGAWVLLCHPALLSFISFLVIDRSSSISQVHAFNVTDSCYRMTRKLNKSNAG